MLKQGGTNIVFCIGLRRNDEPGGGGEGEQHWQKCRHIETFSHLKRLKHCQRRGYFRQFKEYEDERGPGSGVATL